MYLQVPLSRFGQGWSRGRQCRVNGIHKTQWPSQYVPLSRYIAHLSPSREAQLEALPIRPTALGAAVKMSLLRLVPFTLAFAPFVLSFNLWPLVEPEALSNILQISPECIQAL